MLSTTAKMLTRVEVSYVSSNVWNAFAKIHYAWGRGNPLLLGSSQQAAVIIRIGVQIHADGRTTRDRALPILPAFSTSVKRTSSDPEAQRKGLRSPDRNSVKARAASTAAVNLTPVCGAQHSLRVPVRTPQPETDFREELPCSPTPTREAFCQNK